MKYRIGMIEKVIIGGALCFLAGLVWPAAGWAQSYSGSAVAIQAIAGSTTTVVQTGSLPPSGDALEASELSVDVPIATGSLHAETLHATPVGMSGQSGSEASLGGLNLSLAATDITADFVMSRAEAGCSAGNGVASGTSQLSGLAINGTPIVVTGAPNQTILVPGGQVVINEETGSGGSITVNALHVVINGVADVAVASSNAGITCGNSL